MSALLMLIALIGYIIVSIIIIKCAPYFASTDKGKKGARIVALVLVLWFPVLEPIGSLLIHQTYGLLLARASIYKTVQDVDRILIYSGHAEDKIMTKMRDKSSGGRKFAGYSYFEYYKDQTGKYSEEYLRIITPPKEISKPLARYIIEESSSKLHPFSEKRTIIIKDSSGTVIGEYVEILWLGSHVQQWLHSFTSGSPGLYHIFSPSIAFREYVQTVLVPAEKSE